MDEIDAAILRQLQLDARQSSRELARRVGVAPSTALERVRSLERRGVIKGYRAVVDLAALNRGVQAFVTAQVTPLSREVITSFQESISALPEVLQVFVVAGTNDFMVHVAVQSIERLHAFLMDRLSQRQGVVGFQTVVIFQHTDPCVASELLDEPSLPTHGSAAPLGNSGPGPGRPGRLRP